MQKINVKKLIEHFGGAAALESAMAAHGIEDCTIKAIEKWRERGRLPMPRWLQLVEMERSNGKKLPMERFIEREV